MEIGIPAIRKRKNNYFLIVLFSVTVMSVLNIKISFGEGTREWLVNPALVFDTTKSSYTGKEPTTPANCLQIWDQGPSPGGLGRISGTYTSIQPLYDKYRIKIRVCNVGEVINLGFHPEKDQLMYWRLYKPDGTPIKFDGTQGTTNLSAIAGVQTVSASIAGSGSLGPNDFTYKCPISTTASQPGYIKWYSQAAVGPFPSCSTATAGQLGVGYAAGIYCGYNSIQYTVQPGDIGASGYADFFIVLNGNDPVNQQKTVNRILAMFDVTVWTDNISVPRVTKKARLYSASWDMNCNGQNSPKNDYNSKMYIYSKDSVVSAVTFNQMNPWGFVLCANSTGTSNTGVSDFDRRSRIQFYGDPDYPIFLNNPYDTVVAANRTCGIVPKTSFGKLLQKSISGCGNNRCINLMVDRTGTVGITLLPPAGGPSFVPKTFNNTVLNANQNTCIPWDGNDGAGNQIIGPVSIQVNYFNGLTNLPIYDVEYMPYGFIVDLIAPKASVGAKPILVYWDDISFPAQGPTDFTDGDALDGFSNFPVPNTPVGYGNWPGAATPPQAHSTYDLLGCDPKTNHSAGGVLPFRGCHLWLNRGQNIPCPSSGGITCSETENTWWNANVIQVTIPYSSSNVSVFSDTSAAPAPVHSGKASGRTKNVCSTLKAIPITGLIKVDTAMVTLADAQNIYQTHDIPSTGKWSIITGSGTFGSPVSNLFNTYLPDAGGADLARGYVLLKITSDSTKYTACGHGFDTLRINIFQGPHVWTRPGPITVCANNALVALDPGIAGDSSGVSNVVKSYQWTPYVGTTVQTGGTFVSSNQSLGLVATYTPPPSFTSGTVTMRLKSLTTTLPASVTCPVDSAQFNIVVNKVPLIDAGNPVNVCIANSITLSASVGNPTINGTPSIAGFAVKWTGAGTLTNSTTLYPTYTPTAAEQASGSAKIYFSATQGSPSCAPVTDSLLITIVAPPTANAGPDITLCKNNLGVIKLNGVVTNAATIAWAITGGGGSGTFSYVPAAPVNDTATFTPTGALVNSYTLTVTATNASCPAVTNSAILTLTDSASIKDTSFQYCIENPTVQLSVNITPGFNGQWFANAAGTVLPGGIFSSSGTSVGTNKNDTYTLNPSTEAGNPFFGLFFVTSTVGNKCKAQNNKVGITPLPVPTITLPNVSSCANNTTVTLTATLSAVPFSSYTWSSLGTQQLFSPISGTTAPPSHIITTIFTPSAADISNGSVKVVFSLQPINVTCASKKDTLLVTFTAPPTADAGANHNVCANNASVAISGSVTPAATAGHTWSVVSGSGSIASAGNLSTTFTASSPTAGDTTVIRLTASLAGCNTVSNDAFIIYNAAPTAPVITSSNSVCKNNPTIILKGSSPSTGALHWTSGSNCPTCFSDTNAVFLPDSSVYNPTAADIASGSVSFTATTRNNGNCNPVSATKTVSFTAIPTVSINGLVAAVCENKDTISLSGSVSGATGGVWASSSNCAGCFANANNLTTTYIPSSTDLANGTVTFTLTSTGNSNGCNAVQTTGTVTINKAPTVNAGPDLTVCNNLNSVTLNSAASTNTASVAWSVMTGAGTITNPTLLNGAVYNINASDKSGTVILVLTGTGNAGCASVSQQRVISFTNLPTANAGPDKTVCQNDATPAVLDGSGSSGGTWTCAGCLAAIITPGSLTAGYTPAAGDINQTRTFTYSVPAGGGCPAVSDAVNIHFNPAPTVTAGGPYTLCGMSTANLTSTFTNATGVVWTSSGTGSFGNQFTANTTYVPSSADTSGAGIVNLTVTTTGSAPCSAVSVATTLTISKPIIINAGPDQTKCGTASGTLNLSATLSGATFNTWSVAGGSGTLNNPTSLAGATYTIGATDAGNTVTFTALSNANASGTCAAQSDQVSYTFSVAPTATASVGSADICQTGSATLNGTITGTNTGTWACTNCTPGMGSFSPDNTYNNLIPQKSVQFFPAPADTSKASLTFVLTSDNVNVCGVVSSTSVSVNLRKPSKVYAGPNKVVCENNNVFTLSGTMTNSATGQWKSGYNKFTGFSPSSAFPAALTYDPDTIDVQNGFVTLTLYSTGVAAACPVDSSKVTITFSKAPKVNAGLDRTICKNNPTFNLAGTITPASGFNTTWSSPNCGTACFSAPTALNTNYKLMFPADTVGNSLLLFLTATDPSLLCAPVKDTVKINLSEPPKPKITTTFPNPICTDSAYVSLKGTVSSGGYTWSSNGGGTFQINAYQDSVVYPFTAADRARATLPAPNNKVRIYLSTDNGFCLPVKDSVDVTLAPAPVIAILNANDSVTVCANQSTLNLSASVDQAGYTVNWTTSGGGSYAPNPTTTGQSTTYNIAPIDIAAKTIVLVAHTVNPVGSTCRSASSQYKLKITPLPVVYAGANKSVCQTTTTVDLSDATVLNATSATWSTSGSGVFGVTNATVGVGSVYYPTYLLPAGTNDVDQPSITLTLTAVGCSTMTSTRVISFTPKPTANAGVDQTVCNEANSVSVTGTSTNSSSVTWSVAGAATSFATTSTAAYNITGADQAAGFVNLVYTAKGNGSCTPATDTMKVIIRPQPTINIGPNASFCSKNTSDVLAYNFPAITLTNGINPTWTTTGTQSNLDYSNPLQPNYTITNTDITNGSVSITATTRSAAGCETVSSAMTINITQAPTLNIGPDINVCASTGNSIQLNSTSTNSLGSPSWSSSSSGSFNNPNSTTPIYSPAPTEEVAGNTTTIYAIIGGNGSCPSATDSLEINFTATPALAPLKDTVICYTAGVPIVYTVSSGITGDWSSNDPSGLYTPGQTGVPSIIYTTPTTSSFTITFTTPITSCFLGVSTTANITVVHSPSLTVTTPVDVCDNNFAAGVNLNSTSANTNGILWSTIQGFGTITGSTSNTPTYFPKSDSSDFGLSDILVKVTAQGTNPSCVPAVDTVVIRTHKAPSISLTNQIVCSDIVNQTNGVNLTGNVTSGFSTLWSAGANATAINTPGNITTTATISGFQAAFTLSATGLDGSCTPVAKTLTIDKVAPPFFNSPAKNIAGCTNGNSINLNNAAMSPSTTLGVWSKKQALAGGTFNPNNIGATNITYSPSAADIAAGSINLIYTINDTGVCNKVYADTIAVTFNSPVTISASNSPITFCAQDNAVNLTAATSPSPFPAGPVITWSTAGVGVFTSPTNVLSVFYNPNPSGIPNHGDVANGGTVLKVKLSNETGCPDDSAFVSLILVPEPAAIVNAGASQQVCIDRTFVNLQGLVINADGGKWSTNKAGVSTPAVSASGTFSDSTDLEAEYFITAADRAKPKIRLYLFSVGGNSKCHQVVDSVDISFTPRPVPTAKASVPKVCADVDSIPVTGSFSAAGINGIWTSSGDGIYTDLGIYSSSPVYVPGPSDIALGKVVFTYSSDNYQDCKAYSAKDSTIIIPKIVANAGPNLVVCGNDSSGITLNASSPPNNTGTWKPIGVKEIAWAGKFTTTLNSPQATYIPADSIDPTLGAVSFRYTTTGSAPCKADSAQMVLIIAPPPNVTIAANQQTVCNDATSLNLSVTSMKVATGGYWNTTGTGSFTSPSGLSTTYKFSASDLDSTKITLYFTTTGNISEGSSCSPAQDAVVVTLKQKPVVSAVASNSCVSSTGVILNNSSVTQIGNLGVSGVWSASTNPAASAGVFAADQFISNGADVTSYYPSSKDISNGTVTLTLTSAGAGTCLPVSRSVILNVSTTPIADAGKDLFVCTDSSVQLKATPKANLVSYTWKDITTAGAVLTGLEVTDGPILANQTYVLTVTDSKGCSNTDTVAVNTVTNPNLIQKDQQCYDYYGYVHVTIGGAVSPLGGFQWYYNNSLMSSETRDSVRVTQPGFYQVKYSLGGCTDASNKATDILDIPRIKTTNYIACKNTTVTAKVAELPNTQLNALGLMPYTYNWSPASGSTTNTAVLPTSTVNLNVADTMYYDVSSSFTTAFVTCSYKDSVRIISIPVPKPIVADTSQACTGTTISFDPTIAPSNIPSLAAFNPAYNWYLASDSTNSLSRTKLYSTSATGKYMVKVTIDQCSGKDSAVVYMRPYPPKVLVSETTQCFEQVPGLTLDAGPGSVGALGLTGVTYQWTSGSGDPALNTSTSQTTVITYPMIKDLEDEEIIAYASITNHFGTLTCVNIDTAVVKDICVPRIFPPTAFHPIGGGTASTGSGTGNTEDEFFTIKGKYITNFKVTVYSRWGEVIYYSEDFNKFWDGTYRGELMPVGVYAYIITYEGKDDQTKGPFKKEGRVVLIR